MTEAQVISWPIVVALLVLLPGAYLYMRDLRLRQPDGMELMRRIVHLEAQVAQLQQITMAQESEIRELKETNGQLRHENGFLRDKLVESLHAKS